MHRHVIEEIFCEVCESEVESSGHFFWTCLRDQEDWSCSKLVVNCGASQFHLLMVDQRDDDKLAFVVTNIAWALWKEKTEMLCGIRECCDISGGY